MRPNYPNLEAFLDASDNPIIRDALATQPRARLIDDRDRGAPLGSIVNARRLRFSQGVLPALDSAADAIAAKASDRAAQTVIQALDPMSLDMRLKRVPQAVFEPGMYGDLTIVPIIFGAAGDILVLPRPQGTRIYLIIYNDIAATTIRFNTDQIATATIGIPIPPGGNYEPWIVPQNDLHIFSPGAGTVQVGFINRLIATAQAGE